MNETSFRYEAGTTGVYFFTCQTDSFPHQLILQWRVVMRTVVRRSLLIVFRYLAVLEHANQVSSSFTLVTARLESSGRHRISKAEKRSL